MADKNHELRQSHSRQAINQRLDHKQRSYLGDGILGAIDGTITTFAVVAGSAGAGFSGGVVVVLGIANLLADGLSMAVSNYQGSKSRWEKLDQARRDEEEHVDNIPEGEREEIREIFRKKGLGEPELEKVVQAITKNRETWINTMLSEELGLDLSPAEPKKAALCTFAAFLAAGFVPLIPFFLPGLQLFTKIAVSAITAGIVFFLTGAIKAWITKTGKLRSGLTTFLIGGSAALAAYLIGHWLRQLGFAQ